MSEQEKQTENKSARVAGGLLLTVGVLGCLAVMALLVIFPFVAVDEPKAPEMVALAALGIPFIVYIVAVWKRWRRMLVLAVGIPAHVGWLLFLGYPGDAGQFLVGAGLLFGLFIWFALTRPATAQAGS